MGWNQAGYLRIDAIAQQQTNADIMHSTPKLVLAVLLCATATAACDSSAECELVDTQSRMRSEMLQTSAPTPPARFVFSQRIQNYEGAACGINEQDSDRVSLTIVNLTSCEQSLTFQISFIDNGSGWSYNGSATVQASAATDVGVISSTGTANIESSQLLLGGTSAESNCTGAAQ